MNQISSKRLLVKTIRRFLNVVSEQIDEVSYRNKEELPKLREAKKRVNDALALLGDWLDETIDLEEA